MHETIYIGTYSVEEAKAIRQSFKQDCGRELSLEEEDQEDMEDIYIKVFCH